MHILADKISDGESFPKNIATYRKRLAGIIQITSRQLDYSVKSLGCVDIAVRKKLSVKERAGAGAFDVLVAYVGEVIRRNLSGEWQMRFNARHKCWEPWVVSRNGDCAPFVIVYDQLIDLDDETGSLEGAAAAHFIPLVTEED